MQSNTPVAKLNLTRIKGIPIDKYEKNFTFLVNGEQYHINRLVADLLSPKISQLHFSDPTIKEYSITTKHPGNFQHIINLINFEDQTFTEDEIPFIAEILTFFNNQCIQIQLPELEINTSNSLDLLRQYDQYNIFYNSHISKCVDFISSKFDQIVKQNLEKVKSLSQNLIEKIISNDKLRLESEDQLLHIINELYQTDRENSFLYKYVNFSNVSNSPICEFLDIFDYNDMNSEIWEKLSLRIRKDTTDKSKTRVNDTNEFDKSKEIKGIFNYLQCQGNLKNEIKITNSELCSGNCRSVDNLFLFDDNTKYFETQDVQNAFVCFEFNSKQIIPTGYKIKTTSSNSYTPSNWVIEASNDNSNWEIIDNQSNRSLSNNNNWYPFTINNPNMKRYKYIKLRQTGPNSNSNLYLVIGSIDFEGYLV